MNKQDIISELSKHTLTKQEAKKIVDFVFKKIIESLVSGEKVNIQNLGSFVPKIYKAKKMFDPKKKKYVLISPKQKVKFIISKKLVKLLNKKY